MFLLVSVSVSVVDFVRKADVDVGPVVAPVDFAHKVDVDVGPAVGPVVRGSVGVSGMYHGVSA